MSVAKSPVCTVVRLHQLLRFDEAAGVLWWNRREGVRVRPAGSPDPKGHIIVQIDGRNYRAGRVAWAMVYGAWPPDDRCVDHRDRDPSNNRVGNLRLATVAENSRNGRYRGAASGFKGVRAKDGRWQAIIGFEGKTLSLGKHDTPEAAHAEYLRAADKYFGEFAPAGPMHA